MEKLKYLWVVLALVPIYTMANSYEIKKFNESYDPSVNVSGSILSSLLVSGALKLSSPDDLYVYVTPEQSQINLSLVSIDGRYNADVSIEVAVTASSWIKLSLPSEKEEFKKYKFNELVALAYADGRDKRGRYVQEVFPISWGEPDNKITQFYINSAGFAPNYTFNNDVDGKTTTVECEEITDPSARAYNHVCAFSRALIGEKAVITFSPDMESSGKKYIIWTSP